MQALPVEVAMRLSPGANFLSILTGTEVMNLEIQEPAN